MLALVHAVKTSSGSSHIINFTPTLIGRHDAMFDVASLSFDTVSGLRLAVAGLDNVQVSPWTPSLIRRPCLQQNMLCLLQSLNGSWHWSIFSKQWRGQGSLSEQRASHLLDHSMRFLYEAIQERLP